MTFVARFYIGQNVTVNTGDGGRFDTVIREVHIDQKDTEQTNIWYVVDLPEPTAGRQKMTTWPYPEQFIRELS